MADTNSTHIAMLLDRSGSMQAMKGATIEGFNLYMAEQKATPGSCTVTLAQFDDRYEEVYADRPVADVPPLVLEPRGSTALLDSIARLVHTTAERLAALPEDERPATVLVGIMTDGYENASKEYTHAAIKALVTEKETKDGWAFLYMGANQDAIEVGASLGVRRDRSLTYDAGNVGAAMAATSRGTSRMRYAAAAPGGRPGAPAAAGAFYSEEDRAAAVDPGSTGGVRGRDAGAPGAAPAPPVQPRPRTARPAPPTQPGSFAPRDDKQD
ncbi:VWA domain-containing protein [Antribacter sp. KLBMP9083]|uniref:VWA domain-containing protein n=1 Tax=Antribacter soli TaxID=2910976 RepID=A0AA41UAQ4_9MICO|nr:VWA domain-containing protein [Antribacter soli]MCF4122927.1 VWA domain-containing protein [Antribacter soli]